LVDSEYNTRRKECEEGVKILQRHHSSVKRLRDASAPILEKYRSEMDPVVYRRCRYVVEEIARVQEATADLKRGDADAFGRKMFETHRGLSTMYEVSCPELDFLVTEARAF